MALIPLVTASSFRIVLSEPDDLAALEPRWRALEAQADGSFFQGWTWVGCLADRRFPRPLLLEAWRGEELAGLALLNRAGRLRERRLLGETGHAALDAIFVEHNGLLLQRGADNLLPRCLGRLLGRRGEGGGWRPGPRLLLSGVNAAHLVAAGTVGRVRLRQSRPAPFVDLTALKGTDDAFLDSLSANTRYQIRRSMRRYQQIAGPLAVHRAGSVAEGHAFLDALARLHQTTWIRRGAAGAFAGAEFLRFHRALVASGLPRGEIDLLRIDAGAQVVGYLYNFVHRGWVSSYQSGFDYAGAGPHQKPGLTCHAAAIVHYRTQGATAYDFLAGGDRYKTSLANAETTLHWLEVTPRWFRRAPPPPPLQERSRPDVPGSARHGTPTGAPRQDQGVAWPRSDEDGQ
jgi:CelD/BcsL family acetyltransferase involved in cellulose biosynthesis